MGSNLHIWEVLIALMIILSSHFQFYAISLSFSSGILTDPLTANSIATRKDPIFHWSSSLLRLSTEGSSTRASSFQNSLSPGISPLIGQLQYIQTRKMETLFQELHLHQLAFNRRRLHTPQRSLINSQSSLIAPSTTPFFIVPTVTSTISIYLDTNVPQSSTVSAPVIFVTNPSDPNQVVGFKTLQIPESQRTGLPRVTNTAPAALLIPEIFRFPVLLFSDFIIVFPDISSRLRCLLG